MLTVKSNLLLEISLRYISLGHFLLDIFENTFNFVEKRRIGIQ